MTRVIKQSIVCKCGLLLVLLLGLSHWALPQAINTSSIYRNDSVGVRGALAPEWNLITRREQAPDSLKPNFPADKGADDSPLLIGIHDSQQFFIRLLTETFFDDLEAYARVLAQGIKSQGLEILSTGIAADSTAMQIDYHHPELGLRFRERVSILPDSQVIRMASWSSSLTWDTYTSVIDNAFAAIELKDVVNASPGWQTVWANLEQRLLSTEIDGIAGIELAAQSAPTDERALCADPTSSMLWRVESPVLQGNGSQIYLFGSIHVGKPEFYPLAEEIENTYQLADYLVFEVDPNSVSNPAVLMSMQTRGMLPSGQTLADVVSSEVLEEFRRVMGDMGLPADNFMTMQPWFLALMLSSLQMNSLGYLPEYGLESYFLAQKPARTEILELESIQQQIGFLEALNAETYLAYTINTFESGNEEIEKLVDAWLCADKAPLTEMLFAEFENTELSAAEQAEMEALMGSLYTRRNIDMADKIADYASAKQGIYFVVIGSAHLLGEGSVVELLREKRFQVTPVSLSP